MLYVVTFIATGGIGERPTSGPAAWLHAGWRYESLCEGWAVAGAWGVGELWKLAGLGEQEEHSMHGRGENKLGRELAWEGALQE